MVAVGVALTKKSESQSAELQYQLRACTAMAAEIAGASMLPAAFDLLFDNNSISTTSTVVLTKS